MDLFPTGSEFGDVFLSLSDDASFSVIFTFPFAGVYFNNVYINSNGLLSLGTEYIDISVRDFPFNSPPLIVMEVSPTDTSLTPLQLMML